jgi:hypothetical protein
MSRQPPRRRVIAWQRQTLCATVMATGETLNLRELRCCCNLVPVAGPMRHDAKFVPRSSVRMANVW